MPMSNKFPAESTGEKMVKIGQYLAKIWTKYDSLLFLGHPVEIRKSGTSKSNYIFVPSLIVSFKSALQHT